MQHDEKEMARNIEENHLTRPSTSKMRPSQAVFVDNYLYDKDKLTFNIEKHLFCSQNKR